MKKFIAVIGPQNSGKTTIIRSLAGCRTTVYRDWIIDESNQKCLYVISGSPQELKWNQYFDIQTFKKILDDVIANNNCLGLVMAIQPRTPRGRNSMEDYFEVVHNRPSFESFAFLLNPIRNGNTQQVNDIQIKLNRYAPRIEQLDARRFAYLNATRIQEITHIIS